MDPEKRENPAETDEERRQRWAEAAKRAAALRGKRATGAGGRQPVRSINEDDDGYDPYSDFHDKRVEEPFFQKDPWM